MTDYLMTCEYEAEVAWLESRALECDTLIDEILAIDLQTYMQQAFGAPGDDE
jgi:hypothetical protein